MKSLKFFKATLATTLAIVFAWLLSVRAAEAAVADFNGDGHPDFLLWNFNTGQTAAWFLNNNVVIGSVFGPAGVQYPWLLRPGADFNGDGHTDCVLLNSLTEQTVIVYLSGSTVVGFAFGPSLPPSFEWDLVAAADFNGDGRPDYLLFNGNTGETMTEYLNNNVVVGTAQGPTLPAGWTLIWATADFNSDGHPDCVVVNPLPNFMGGGQTAIVYLSGSTVIGVAPGPTIPPSWVVQGTADFDGDGHPDFLLYNFNTRETVIDYLSNNVLVNAAMGPNLSTLPLGWVFPF
jgi:FG-GAP-like repeat